MSIYAERLVAIDDALSHVEPGDHVWVTVGQLVGPLVTGLLARAAPDRPIVATGWFAQDLDWYTPEIAELVRLDVVFANPPTREPVNDLRADYTPWWVWGAHKAREEGRPGARGLDVTFIRVSPPNRAGWMCLGNSVWDAKSCVRLARTTIALVSERVPATFGDSWIHASEIDWFVEEPPDTETPVGAMTVAQADPWDQPIADHVATLVRDGDTFQVGLGTTTGYLARLGAFDARNDLGYFAELTVPGIVGLVQQGVITGARMTTHPGKCVATQMGNGPADRDAIDGNAAFEMYSTDYLHHPGNIARNDNMVSINNALSLDLTGQIAAGQIGGTVWSGTGGQLSFQMGAVLSQGGRAVTVLPSTARHGAVSRIVPHFPAGQIVSVPRDLTDIVVTEHGIAHLLNKNQRERAEALIEIAHPDFRSELRREAKRLYGG